MTDIGCANVNAACVEQSPSGGRNGVTMSERKDYSVTLRLTQRTVDELKRRALREWKRPSRLGAELLTELLNDRNLGGSDDH